MRNPLSGRFRALALAAAAAVSVAGCTERRTAERADSDLAHDLALANQVSASPALNDTAQPPAATAPQPSAPIQPPARTRSAQAPAPRVPAAAPAPVPPAAAPTSAANTDSIAAAPAPAAMVIGAGTGIMLTSGMRVCTNTNKIGDQLVATVSSPVAGSGGATIPSGSRVVLEVSQVAPDDSVITFRPTAIYVGGSTYPVSGTVASTTPMQRTDVPSTGVSDKEKVVGGALAGAILGQLLGHNTKSTVIGAAAGAATGAVVAKAQKQYQACLPEGAALVLTLNAPVTLH